MKQILLSLTSKAFCFWLIFALVLLMGASSAEGQKAPAKLRIYKKSYSGPGFGLKINEQMVVDRLKNRSWIEVEVPEGKLVLETIPEIRYPTNEGKSFSLEVESGKLYYLEAVLDYEFWVSSLYLILREKERAEKEMKRFKQGEYVLKKVE
ncbi:MAG: hypothetical protein AAF696_14500 [Bacteroidota bacterium]